MKWLKDEAGDLINADHIELITMVELEQVQEEEHPEYTNKAYEVLAINNKDESYRLYIGTEEGCRAELSSLRSWLTA